MEYITLANGVKMPLLGYGVYQVDPAECERCVTDAIAVGYRSIDTAQAYHNEEGVGNAVRKSGLPREDWERYLDSREEITPEDRLVLTQCMRRLNDQERQIVVLHAVSGFKHREIAELMELPVDPAAEQKDGGRAQSRHKTCKTSAACGPNQCVCQSEIPFPAEGVRTGSPPL